MSPCCQRLLIRKKTSSNQETPSEPERGGEGLTKRSLSLLIYLLKHFFSGKKKNETFLFMLKKREPRSLEKKQRGKVHERKGRSSASISRINLDRKKLRLAGRAGSGE